MAITRNSIPFQVSRVPKKGIKKSTDKSFDKEIQKYQHLSERNVKNAKS